MPRFDLDTLRDIVELRKAREDELIEELARASAVLRDASREEHTARELLQSREQALQISERRGLEELEDACTVASIAEQGAYRKRLLAARDEASSMLEESIERRKEAEVAFELIRENLAEAAAKRKAAEQMASRTEREIKKLAEDQLDEEMTEMAGMRIKRGEER